MTMTHEEKMNWLMAEYWRRIEEEENKKKEEIAMMTYEELMNRAWQFIEGISWLITDDKAEFEKDPDHLVLVDDIYKVRDAYYDDLENGYEDEDEDIYGFLDRHGIEWQ